MFYFTLDVYAPVASFRLPEAHTFQQTLPLPPVTTLTGIMGAALGLSLEDAFAMREEKGIYCGVLGTHEAIFRDLWKYQKIKSGETISAVLLREHLYNIRLTLVYASEDEKTIRKLYDSFNDPVYALTAGSSDDLLKIKKIQEVQKQDLQYQRRFSNTILPGDHSNNYEADIKIEEMPILQDMYMPRVYTLPESFYFEGGKRSVKSKQAYTFVDVPIQLIQPIKGLNIEGKAVGLL